MKFTLETEINCPLKKVIVLFDNPNNLHKWQPELVSFVHLSGKPGQVGARSKLKYRMENRDFEMVETIVKRNLPDEFSGVYETQGMKHVIINRFAAAGTKKTNWIVENEITFSGFAKIMSIFMRGYMRKQVQKTLNQFKKFAEDQK